MEKLVISIFPHPSKRKELLSACLMIASQTLKENGCVDCRVFEESGGGKTIRIDQHWRHQGLLEDYFRSDHFTALLGAMILLAINHEVVINDNSPSNGSLIVNRARNKE